MGTLSHDFRGSSKMVASLFGVVDLEVERPPRMPMPAMAFVKCASRNGQKLMKADLLKPRLL